MGKVKAGPAVTGYPTFGRLPADVGTAMVFVHAVHTLVGAVYAGVLVVTEKEATVALALIAAHGVDTDLLAATVVVLALIHIQAVVSIVGQHEAIEAGAPVVPRDVDAVMDTAPVVVVVLTLVDIFTLPPLALVAGLAETFVRLGCVLADGIYVAVICALRALIHVRSSW